MGLFLLLLLGLNASLGGPKSGPTLRFEETASEDLQIGNGQIYTGLIDEIHPGQSVVGMEEVRIKKKKIQKKSKKGISNYFSARPVQTVLGPGRRLWLIDGHHLTLIAYLMHRKRIEFKIEDDLSGLSGEEFQKEMIRKRYVYLKDENGNPIPFSELVQYQHIKDVKNDPYRTLVWKIYQRLEKNGIDADSNTRFGEFDDEEHLRQPISLKALKKNPKSSVKRGVEILLSVQEGRSGPLGCVESILKP